MVGRRTGQTKERCSGNVEIRFAHAVSNGAEQNLLALPLMSPSKAIIKSLFREAFYWYGIAIRLPDLYQ